jgi:hypothetical protein
MGLLSGNSCNIITILPLGLDCDSINSSTPDSTNGLITLYVTGGTSPYNISWSNGSQGSLLTNLLPGQYTATVTDYYRDFTATTTCNVDYDSFYLEQFEDCQNLGNFVYYVADLPSKFLDGNVYGITSQSGCWIHSGQTLYTGQSYVNNFAVISTGPFNTCLDCLPTPTPTPVYPQNLCFEYTPSLNTTYLTTLSSGSTINGYPSWYSSNYVVFYSTGNTRWEVSGWTNSGVPALLQPTTPPTGNWSLLGTSQGTVFVSTGVCNNPPLILSLNMTQPTCSNTSDGIINVTGYGGVPSYTYSINGVNYQVSNTFLGLSTGNYTIYIKDTNNTVTTQSATLTPQNAYTNYVLNLSLTPLANVVNVGTTITKTSYYQINVTPTLPIGKTVNFTINTGVGITGKTFMTDIPVITNTITATTLGSATLSLPTNSVVTSTGQSRPSCEISYVNFSSYTNTYTATISSNGVINGTITQFINTPTMELRGCQLEGYILDTVTITNVTITPSNCSGISVNGSPKLISLQKIGFS